MTRDISSFPPKVLKHIFYFLDIDNRLSASLVCKKWLQVTDCPNFLCDVKIQFSRKINEALKLFSRMTRRFQCFSFHNVVIRDPVVEFLLKYHNQFDNLSFTECKIDEGKFRQKMQGKMLHFDNLKTLRVHNSDITFLFAPLRNVTELKLHIPFGLTDYVICKLGKYIFRLEKLTLGSNIICKDGLDKKFYASEETIETNPSHEILSFVIIKGLMEKNRSTLTHVNLASLRLSPPDVLTISKIKGLNLRSVAFPSYYSASYAKEFCINQFNLASINLSRSVHVTNDIVCDICKCLPNLQEMVLCYCEIDWCIIEIFQLQNLEKLDLSSCLKITYLSYVMAISILKSFKLKYLNLEFAKISDKNLFELLQNNPNICSLNLTGISVSNETLNMICQKLTLLECLILESCTTISDSGLTGEFNNYSDSITPTPLSNLKYLKELSLRGNNLITNQGCLKAIWFPELKILSLKDCHGLILNEVFLLELRIRNPCLQHF
ncbi:hypothetical protein TNCT_69291 [Trichonephila clavata]|uniref:F-box domain-containing protein n=1 Tax=Trichonephila clavata TaxID=2740835 RepID=A0A8X6J5X0_TRICU|nr:hypothetical protein TNCT_69291 [Trichonephila clavata]